MYQNDFITAFIAPIWWVNNPGHVIVIPNKHYENIYSVPDDQLAEVYKAVKKIGTGLRNVYEQCQGISTRQHNEPSGDQDIWHLHAHVFPRYKNDKLNQNHDSRRFATPHERLPYAKRLKAHFDNQKE